MKTSIKYTVTHFSHILISVLASAVILLSFSGCREKKSAVQENDSTQIMATFYPLYIILLNITDGAENVSLSMLAPADTGCLHDYQLTTRDMKNLEKCDILVMNGAGMEDFVDKALSVKPEDHIIIAAQDYPLVDENAHVWVSPSGELYEAQRITEGLCTLNPENAETYRKNFSEYAAKVEDVSIEMHSLLDDFAGDSIVTFHEAFPYFASEFNLNIAASIEREAGTEPSAKELAEIINTVKKVKAENGKTALFAEPQYSSSAASVIAEETGLKVGELDPSVSGELYADAWIDAMKNNAAVIKELLSE